jgi:hypothetical protein
MALRFKSRSIGLKEQIFLVVWQPHRTQMAKLSAFMKGIAGHKNMPLTGTWDATGHPR